MAKPKFKLGDRVKFTRVAQRNMTLLAEENDPKPWWDVKWISVNPQKRVASLQSTYGFITVRCGKQQGIYIGTRVKQNGILVCDNRPDEPRRQARFKRLASVSCGLIVTDVRKQPILVLIEDLEHV